MRILKYRGNFLKNEVWVNAWTSLSNSISPSKLFKLFGDLDSELKPDCIIKVKFEINKEGQSWVELRGEKTIFTYEVVNLGFGTSKELYIKFSVHQKITRGIDLYEVPIISGGTSKKEIVKYLLDILISGITTKNPSKSSKLQYVY